MDTLLPVVPAVSIALTAALYSCVGHGGASGYIAVMILFGFCPEVIKPTALFLNILVSGIAAVQFYRAGFFRANLFWPFACTSIPCSLAGGYFVLSDGFYSAAVGGTLLFSAFRLLLRTPEPAGLARPPVLPAALFSGAVIGLTSGLIGVGGGIFLSPFLILAGWAGTKEAAAVSAFFVLANSLAGLLGYAGAAHGLPPVAAMFAIAAVAGGIAGSYLGSRKFSRPAISRALSLVLMIASLKLIRALAAPAGASSLWNVPAILTQSFSFLFGFPGK